MIKRHSLYFTAPHEIAIRTEPLPELLGGQVLVKTRLSAISAGTESLLYRGQFPENLPMDDTIHALAGQINYPQKYGYCAVGCVIATGPGVDQSWLNRDVFAFNPHECHFSAFTEDLYPIPVNVSAEDAVFLPNMETAVNLVMDSKPIIGEHVVVLGQGIIGLLTNALLAQFPLERLITIDRYANRRQLSLELGAHVSLDPDSPDVNQALRELIPEGADLSFELSGSPEALNHAIALTRFSGRVVIGSWYGTKLAHLDLGGRFHRSRIQIISSQVSTLAPEYTGRWDRSRRFSIAWAMLSTLNPSRFITHRFQIQDAAQAYKLIDQNPEKTIQVILEYD